MEKEPPTKSSGNIKINIHAVQLYICIHIRTRVCAHNGLHRTVESLVGQGFQLTGMDVVLHNVGVFVVGFIAAAEIACHVDVVLEYIHALDNGLVRDVICTCQKA